MTSIENNSDTQQKVAVITGGGSGLGLAVANKFALNNIKSILIGRDKNKLRKACSIVGPLSDCYATDLTNLAELPKLVAKIIQEHNRIDILVNNAGIHLKKSLFEVSDDEFREIVNTNQMAVFSLTREVAIYMKKQGRGSIVNISSMASRYGIPKVIAYTSSKSAVEGMTRALAVELSPIGIRVNCIAPGFIETDMSTKALNNDPERKRKVLSRTPLGRLGKSEEVAEAVFFLTSEASSFITGVILPVDGGNSIGF
ncbi:MAG: SDR family oxidoreductase [Bacteroidales bacterium]|nr:SDR family oxidoreductase [Bacteroidales bacterium]